MANSTIKHINLGSIGTTASGVSAPGFKKKKSMKKKIRQTSSKVAQKGKGGGAIPKDRRVKRVEKKAPPKKGKGK